MVWSQLMNRKTPNTSAFLTSSKMLANVIFPVLWQLVTPDVLAFVLPPAGSLNSPTTMVDALVCFTVVKWGTDPVVIGCILIAATVMYQFAKISGDKNASIILRGASIGAFGLLSFTNVVQAFMFTGQVCS
jgi:hypothetical protein